MSCFMEESRKILNIRITYSCGNGRKIHVGVYELVLCFFNSDFLKKKQKILARRFFEDS